MTGTLNAAVVGCGNVAREHFAALARMKNVNIVAAVDIDAARAVKYADEYGCAALTDYNELLLNHDVDVVHICTPHHMHAPIALYFLNAGKYVLCEKPLAHELDDALRMAEADGGRLGTVFQNRYNQSSRIAYEVCQDGFLGQLKSLKAFVCWNRGADYYAADAWRGKWATEGGGALINQAIHTIDLVRWFAGTPVSVRGKVSTDALHDSIEVEDSAHFRLTFESGAVCVFYATLGYAADSPPEIELQFERGALRMRGDTLWRMADDGALTMLSGPSSKRMGDKAYWGSGHALLIDDFYRGVQESRPFWLGGMEGYKTLRIVKGVYQSSKSGSTVILNT